jgi:dGTPase
MKYEKFLLIKLSEKSTDIVKRVKESHEKEEYRYYNSTTKDKEELSCLENISKNYKVVFVIFTEDEDKYNEKEIYLGETEIVENRNLHYKIGFVIESKLVISNFLEHLGLDMKRDFDNNSYLSVETSMSLYKQLEFSARELFKIERVSYNEQEYNSIPCESDYDELSQKNEYCRRYICRTFDNGDNKTIRGEFQRDRERITHAKAMRRLVDKAQIFTSTKGDHFRTRMTHTLEVSQIARGISSNLNLNNELVEAIALAHDIGHTPFGHQGERTLDCILKNKIEIIKECDALKMGGFKHSFQGIRVLSHLEEKYLDFDGLDISYQVLEGVLKHTKIQKPKDCNDCLNCKDKKCFNIDEFLINGEKEKLFLDYAFPTTLEGQIVNIADEIAQRGHDLDDALASNHLTISELLETCSIKRMDKIKSNIEEIQKIEEDLKNKNRVFVDESDIKRSRIVSNIITFFIDDVTKTSREKMEEYKKKKYKFFEDKKIVDEKIICFSKDGEFILKYLEKLIGKKVINSFDISRFDGKSGKIVEKLFRSYYENIMFLPDSTLKRMYLDIRKFSKNVIDFRDGDVDIVRDEIDKICKGDLKDLPNEYLNKRKVIVRNIADHISGMTDNYAISEYKKIYNVE